MKAHSIFTQKKQYRRLLLSKEKGIDYIKCVL